VSELRLRRACADDLVAIVAMLADDMLGAEREVVSNPPAPGYVAAFEAIDSDNNQLLAVAEIGGELVGCLQLTFLPGLSRQGAWRGQIEGVRVAANARGRGVGEAIVRWAVARCRERGCRVVQLTTDRRRVDAQRFYARLGFETTHAGMKLDL